MMWRVRAQMGKLVQQTALWALRCYLILSVNVCDYTRVDAGWLLSTSGWIYVYRLTHSVGTKSGHQLSYFVIYMVYLSKAM